MKRHILGGCTVGRRKFVRCGNIYGRKSKLNGIYIRSWKRVACDHVLDLGCGGETL